MARMAVLAWLLDSSSLQRHCKQRLRNFRTWHAIDLQRMGFAADWEQRAICQENTS